MNLIEYANARRGGKGTITCPVFQRIADTTGVKVNHIHQVALGFKKPSAKLAVAISTATRGAVSTKELRPDIFGPVSAKRGVRA